MTGAAGTGPAGRDPANLDDGSSPTHQLAEVVIAGHRGDVPTVTGGLTADDPQVRAAALGALHRLGELAPRHLHQAFADPSPVVRRRSAELAASFPGLDLSALLDDTDPTVAEVAAWSCGEHEVVADHVLDRLIRLAVDADDPIVRESAAAALGAIGDPLGLPAILAACRDKPAVRRRAVLALAPFLDDDDPEDDDPDDSDPDDSDPDDSDPDDSDPEDDDPDDSDPDDSDPEDDDPDDSDPDDSDPEDAVPGMGEAARAALEVALTDRDWQVRQAAEDLVRARRGGVW